MRDRKGIALDGSGVGERLEGVEIRETYNQLNHGKEKPYFQYKEKDTIKNE